jgi:hypothetical protein
MTVAVTHCIGIGIGIGTLKRCGSSVFEVEKVERVREKKIAVTEREDLGMVVWLTCAKRNFRKGKKKKRVGAFDFLWKILFYFFNYFLWKKREE